MPVVAYDYLSSGSTAWVVRRRYLTGSGENERWVEEKNQLEHVLDVMEPFHFSGRDFVLGRSDAKEKEPEIVREWRKRKDIKLILLLHAEYVMSSVEPAWTASLGVQKHLDLYIASRRIGVPFVIDHLDQRKAGQLFRAQFRRQYFHENAYWDKPAERWKHGAYGPVEKTSSPRKGFAYIDLRSPILWGEDIEKLGYALVVTGEKAFLSMMKAKCQSLDESSIQKIISKSGLLVTSGLTPAQKQTNKDFVCARIMQTPYLYWKDLLDHERKLRDDYNNTTYFMWLCDWIFALKEPEVVKL